MKKTIMKTTMLAAIASLAMSGNAFAHHPTAVLSETNDQLDGLYERIDGNISDMHNEVVGDIEDYTFMGNLEMSTGEVPSNQASVESASMGDVAVPDSTSNLGVAPQPAIPRAGTSNFGGTPRTGR